MWITFCANSLELLYVCRQKDLFCFQSYLIFLCLNVFVSVKSVKKKNIYIKYSYHKILSGSLFL